MALSINSNILSLTTQRRLKQTQSGIATSLQKLSSGLRINSAKDDAAGLAISERLNSQIRGLNQANRNANEGISMLQVAESAMTQISELIQRGRELSVQAANDSYNSSDRENLQSEINQILSEINRIGSDTEFNGIKLFTGGNQQASYIDKDGVVDNFDNKEAVINGLMRSWLQQSESIISEYFGLSAENTNLEIILEDTIPGNAAAFVAATFSGSDLTRLTLNIDMGELSAIGTDWPNDTIDQLIAHEMTHAVMDATTNVLSFENWFLEGAAEFLPGGDARLQSVVAASSAAAVAANITNSELRSGSWDPTQLNYATAYAATRYFHDIAGGDGIKNVMNYLSEDKTRTLDDYFAQAGIAGISDTDDFVSSFQTNGAAFIGTMDLANDDTGAIGGADAGGGLRDTTFTGTVPDISAPSSNPLQGFNEIWPDFVDNRRLITETATHAKFQVGANADSDIDVFISVINSGDLGLAGIDLVTDAQTAISHFDVALKNINTERAAMGAVLNRFENISTHLQTAAENNSASRSRIIDTDFGLETARLTKFTIMQQASTAILSQANASPQIILSLLS